MFWNPELLPGATHIANRHTIASDSTTTRRTASRTGLKDSSEPQIVQSRQLQALHDVSLTIHGVAQGQIGQVRRLADSAQQRWPICVGQQADRIMKLQLVEPRAFRECIAEIADLPRIAQHPRWIHQIQFEILQMITAGVRDACNPAEHLWWCVPTPHFEAAQFACARHTPFSRNLGSNILHNTENR